jgi:DNA-binding MltR family transcriptional regulator
MTLRADIEAAFRQWNKVYGQLDNKNDQVSAICAMVYFEKRLERSIEEKFIKLSNTKREDIFEGNGPLATCFAKIQIGYALGLFESRTATDLCKANSIRNKFAHSFEPLTYREPKILKLTSELTTPHTHALAGDSQFGISDSRGRYLTTLWCIGLDLRRPPDL